jgi:uncharacterized membrane protein HdeD (DUF308 family)
MAKGFARILGVLLTLIGVVGFFLPTEGTIHNLLHLTLTHNLFHLISGVLFLAVSNEEKWSLLTARIFGVLYGIIAILGLFLKNIAGLVENTATIEVIHILVALAALYVGFKDSAMATKLKKGKHSESNHS